MKLLVNDQCCVCSNCSKACPVAAPYYDGDKIAIDHEKCISCGACIRACRLGAIYDAEKPQPPVEAHALRRYDCDLCVLGSGAAGMIAAARVAEAGKKVILLEKGKGVSGSTPYATGLNIADSAMGREAGVAPAEERMVQMALQRTGGELDPQLITNSIHALAEFFDWCAQWTRMEDYFTLKKNPFGQLGVDCIDSDHGAGVFVADRFPQRLKQLGVEVLSYTPAKQFVVENDTIVAVDAEDAGGPVRVYAKAFLIATGSLVNGEILNQTHPGYSSAFTRRYGHRVYTLTGDGVAMARDIGVPINYDKIAVAYIGYLCMPVDMQGIHFGRPIDTEMLCQIARKEAIRINKLGKRWMNEAFTGEIAPLLTQQPDMLSYTVMDHRLVTTPPADPMKQARAAGPGGPPPMPSQLGATPGAVYEKPTDLEKLQHFASLKGKHLLIADTLEELAEKMEVPVEQFVATVQAYNAACAQGEDGEFGKAAQYLQPICQAPYYAFSGFLATDGAFGGIEVDANLRVIGQNGAMANLYAAGDVCSSYYTLGGDRKNTITNDFSWAVASGYVAGGSIAEKLCGEPA